MSFESELQENIFEPWRYEYVPFRLIKQHLQQQKNEQGWTDQEEHKYQTSMRLEADKVEQFVTRKQREIESRIGHCQRLIQSNNQQQQQQQRRSYTSAKATLQEIYLDLEELARFTRYNYRAFQHIVAFHDELTGLDTRPLLVELMHDKPLDTQRFDPLLIKLGSLDDEASHQIASSSSSTPPPPPVSTTTYFWVHEHNLNQLKAMLLFHLPENIESHVTTYYLDNLRTLDMYYGRLQRDDDGTEIRLEQMGKDLVVRRDVYQPGWSNVPLEQKAQAYSECRVEDFLSFTHASSFPLTSIVQSYVQHYGLEPSVAMSCNRAWYGQGGGSGAIVHLDTDVEFSRVGAASSVPVKFPHAILETTVPSNTTDLIGQLVDMGLAYEVPAFSAFLHGTACLYAPLALVPWWMRGDMVVDIRNGKSPSNYPSTEWMTFSRNLRRSGDLGCLDRQLRMHRLSAQDVRVRNRGLQKSPSFRSASSTPMSVMEREPLIAVDMDRSAPLMKGGVDPIFAAVIPEDQEQGDDNNNGKNKKTKQRKPWLEPKIFFANERTFIHWLQFSALILTAALTLLNFGDRISTIAGAVFFGISMGVALYAFGRYRYRAHQIKTRPMLRYDDLYGPIGLTILLVGALILNFILRYTHPPTTSTYLGINNSTRQQ